MISVLEITEYQLEKVFLPILLHLRKVVVRCTALATLVLAVQFGSALGYEFYQPLTNPPSSKAIVAFANRHTRYETAPEFLISRKTLVLDQKQVLQFLERGKVISDPHEWAKIPQSGRHFGCVGVLFTGKGRCFFGELWDARTLFLSL